MTINLQDNDISDEWADYIMNHWELKPWMVIDFRNNDNISEEKQKELEEWVQWFRNRWINCKVEVWYLVL
jgi:hypothetical protein